MNLKQKTAQFIENVKQLKGDPHYIAAGMSIGIFIGITPTFPFHTILALALAYAFRASKAAAAIGVWIGNPLTMPFLYLGSYKAGSIILGTSIPFDMKYTTFTELTKLGLKATIALMTGGIVIGIPFCRSLVFDNPPPGKKIPLQKKALKSQSGKICFMTSPRTLLSAYNLSPKKQFGQNFLSDPSTAEMIVSRSGILKEDIVLEIGAGLGALTVPIAMAVNTVYAVEKDRNLLPPLQSELLAKNIDNVRIVNENILEVDIESIAAKHGRKIAVMGNLPYNISSQILIKLIIQRIFVSRAILMFQKELSERICAKPGGKDYGRISVMLQYCSDIRKIADIKASLFFPKPRIDSQIIEIRFKEVRPFRQIMRTFFSA